MKESEFVLLTRDVLGSAQGILWLQELRSRVAKLGYDPDPNKMYFRTGKYDLIYSFQQALEATPEKLQSIISTELTDGDILDE